MDFIVVLNFSMKIKIGIKKFCFSIKYIIFHKDVHDFLYDEGIAKSLN